ncbi:MAG: 4'-phosphopantetheinyl transferase family protein [Streptosporangiaceae bacterium]
MTNAGRVHERPSGLLARILPSAAVTAESAGRLPGSGAGLFPAEEAAIRTAGPWRRAEFTAGRLCARAALAGLGMPAAAILTGPAGQPQWPAGVTGSITHCPGYRACAVARASDVTAIGIDAEPDEDLPDGLISAVAAAPEQAWIRRQAATMPAVHWERLIFSAKEAAAKCWYPLTGQWPGWHDLTVSAAAAGTFTVCLPGGGQGLPASLTGRWLARDGLILTAIAWSS